MRLPRRGFTFTRVSTYRTNTHGSDIRYNGLPRINPRLPVQYHHINPILDIIVRHGYKGKLGLHLLHRHNELRESFVRLESTVKSTSGKQNVATLIDNLKLEEVHAVMFQVLPSEQRLVPFEFGKGPPPTHSLSISQAFLQDCLSYYTNHGLSDAFALEILDEKPHEGCTAEVEVSSGDTIVLPQEQVTAEAFLPTGWSGSPSSEESSPPPGQTWAVNTDGSHKVFQN